MAIETTDITTGEVAGRGFYDELMRTSKAHLDQEYADGRITGADFATVYLGVMTSNLNTASNVIMQRELSNLRIRIEEENLDNVHKQGLLIDAQIAQAVAQTALLTDELTNLRPKQATQLDNQNTLLVNQNSGQVLQNLLIDEQTAGQIAQNLVIGKQKDLIDEQIKTEATNTVDAIGGLAKASLDKTSAEVSILGKKEVTETAQTLGQIDDVFAANYISGLIGSEMKLKTEQKESFVRDAEQKTAKFYADMLSIAYSTAPDDSYNDPAAWGFGQVESNRVTTKLLSGIGA